MTKPSRAWIGPLEVTIAHINATECEPFLPDAGVRLLRGFSTFAAAVATVNGHPVYEPLRASGSVEERAHHTGYRRDPQGVRGRGLHVVA